jgi:hypothetical protein
MSELNEAKLRHPSTGALQEVIATTAQRAFNTGVQHEQDRIVKLISDKVTILDGMRPESYKVVADMADLRIRTMRKVIDFIKEESKSQSE